MIYLSHFEFPDIEKEYDYRLLIMRKETCYNTMYPFFVLSERRLNQLDFEPITILYGGNGSGKTTALNIIAEKLGLLRDSRYNRSSFYEDYLHYCSFRTETVVPKNSRIVTSDDVFDFMLNIRCMNEGIDHKRDDLFDEYYDSKHAEFQVRSLDDYEQLSKIVDARRKTKSQYVKERLMKNVREQSNGESGYFYFTDKIRESGLYLLDEPENSLSPEKQLELLEYLEDSARYCDCQLIVATHSPFLLSMRGAKIYDFDENPVDVKRWYELKNVRTYYDFFKKYESDFRR